MMGTVAAMKGRLGDTDYYILSMKAQALADAVKIPKELEGWEDISLEERYQRDLNYGRVKKQIAPYFANDDSRFFGAIIVAAMNFNDDGMFEKLSDVVPKKDIIGPYKPAADTMGFLTFRGGEVLVPLDGQHRLKAIQFAVTGRDERGRDIPDIPTPCTQLAQEDVTVILVPYESTKARRIFTRVNRYAKPTTTGQNIVTDDDDFVAVLAREVTNDLIGARLVKYASNTLNSKDPYFTTLSIVYNCNDEIIKTFPGGKIDKTVLPSRDEQRLYREKVREVWEVLIENIEVFASAPGRPREHGRQQSSRAPRAEPARQTGGPGVPRPGVYAVDEPPHQLLAGRSLRAPERSPLGDHQRKPARVGPGPLVGRHGRKDHNQEPQPDNRSRCLPRGEEADGGTEDRAAGRVPLAVPGRRAAKQASAAAPSGLAGVEEVTGKQPRRFDQPALPCYIGSAFKAPPREQIAPMSRKLLSFARFSPGLWPSQSPPVDFDDVVRSSTALQVAQPAPEGSPREQLKTTVTYNADSSHDAFHSLTATHDEARRIQAYSDNPNEDVIEERIIVRPRTFQIREFRDSPGQLYIAAPYTTIRQMFRRFRETNSGAPNVFQQRIVQILALEVKLRRMGTIMGYKMLDVILSTPIRSYDVLGDDISANQEVQDAKQRAREVWAITFGLQQGNAILRVQVASNGSVTFLEYPGDGIASQFLLHLEPILSAHSDLETLSLR